MENPDVIPESLDKEVDHTIEEARMVLPGIQALFGFQLIAVFNQPFTALSPSEQRLHLCALVLVGIAIALIMAPAAYHRQAERGFVSRHLANYASQLITIAMVPLLIAIVTDVGLVAIMITSNQLFSMLLAIALALFFAWFWFVIPRFHRIKKSTRNNHPVN